MYQLVGGTRPRLIAPLVDRLNGRPLELTLRLGLDHFHILYPAVGIDAETQGHRPFDAGLLAKLMGYRKTLVVMLSAYFVAMTVAFYQPWGWEATKIQFAVIGACQGVFGLFTMCLPPLFPILLRTEVTNQPAGQSPSSSQIGPGIAGKIVEERKKGSFKDWNDMVERVKGVGEGNAAKFSAEGLTVNGATFKGAAAPAAKLHIGSFAVSCFGPSL